MKKLALFVAIAALLSSTLFAGSVPNPINAPTGTVPTGHILATTANPQQAADGGVIGALATKGTGTSVVDPGTGLLEAVLPVQTTVSASKGFLSADLYKETRRSNAGSAMTDTFPASTATGLVNGTRIVLNNVDATATDTITAGAGTTINSGATAAVGPLRSVTWVYDAPNTMWRSTLNGTTAALTNQANTFSATQLFSAGINITGGTIQQNGSTLITSQGGTGYLVAGLGSIVPSTGGSETVIFGNFVNKSGNSGVHNSYFGDFVAGYETNGSFTTGLGNDAFRNANGLSGNIAVGQSSQATMFGPRNISMGFGAMIGAASSVVLSGTPGATGTVAVTVTAAGLTGSPITITANVTSSEALSAIIGDLATAMSANANFFADNIYPQTFSSVPGLAAVLGIGHQGTNVAGADNMTVTVNVTGAAGLSASVAYATTTAADNISIGTSAMAGIAMTTATTNIGIGTFSLSSITSGTNNIGIGSNSGLNIQSGSQNTLVGASAGGAATGGVGSLTAVGYQAAVNATAGGIVAVGTNAGANFTSGSGQSVFVGNNAGLNITTGFGSTFVGNLAGNGAVSATGILNTAVGASALQKVSSGQSNTIIGAVSGNSITTGGWNVLVGYNVAPNTLTTGASNIFICTGRTTCDAGSSGTSNTMGMYGNNSAPFLGASGTDTPSTSVIAIPGLLTVTGATTHSSNTFNLTGSTFSASGCTALTVAATTGALGCTVSDRRLKLDGGVFSDDTALADILAMPDLHTYQFKYGQGPGGHFVGYFAQDVQAVHPGWVMRGAATELTPDGILQYDQSHPTAELVGAVKALNKRVVAIEALPHLGTSDDARSTSVSELQDQAYRQQLAIYLLMAWCAGLTLVIILKRKAS